MQKSLAEKRNLVIGEEKSLSEKRTNHGRREIIIGEEKFGQWRRNCAFGPWYYVVIVLHFFFFTLVASNLEFNFEPLTSLLAHVKGPDTGRIATDYAQLKQIKRLSLNM